MPQQTPGGRRVQLFKLDLARGRDLVGDSLVIPSGASASCIDRGVQAGLVVRDGCDSRRLCAPFSLREVEPDLVAENDLLPADCVAHQQLMDRVGHFGGPATWAGEDQRGSTLTMYHAQFDLLAVHGEQIRAALMQRRFRGRPEPCCRELGPGHRDHLKSGIEA